jgi:hypothetical protein
MNKNECFIFCELCNKKINKYYFKKHMNTKKHNYINLDKKKDLRLKKHNKIITLIFD